jgi:hypothetical protein
VPEGFIMSVRTTLRPGPLLVLAALIYAGSALALSPRERRVRQQEAQELATRSDPNSPSSIRVEFLGMPAREGDADEDADDTPEPTNDEEAAPRDADNTTQPVETAPQPAGEQKRVPVTLRCDRPELVAGLALRAIALSAETRLYEFTPNRAQFDKQGVCNTTLPPGMYTFEVLGAQGATLVALRAPAVSVPAPSEIVIHAAPPVPLTLSSPPFANLPLQQVAIRSIASYGEIQWSTTPGLRPNVCQVALTPDSGYNAHVLASFPSRAYAVWTQLQGGAPALPIQITAAAVGVTKLSWAPGAANPAIAGRVVFTFPDATLITTLTTETLLATNRRTAEIGYGIPTTSGRVLHVHPRGYSLPAPRQSGALQLGSASLHLQAVCHVLQHDRHKTSYQLGHWAELVDATGHEHNEELSGINLRPRLWAPDGHMLTLEEIRGPKAQVEAVAAQPLRASVNLDLGDGPTTFTALCERFQPMRSPNFKTHMPVAWAWRAELYLRKCERVFRVMRQVTGRIHKKALDLKWHADPHYALGSPVMIDMPFGAFLEEHHDWKNPWALEHETLHGYGYGHGAEMNYRNNLAGRVLKGLRFAAADHPETVEPQVAKLDESGAIQPQQARQQRGENQQGFNQARQRASQQANVPPAKPGREERRERRQKANAPGKLPGNRGR